MKGVLFTVFALSLLTSSLSFACDTPEVITAVQLGSRMLKSETTLNKRSLKFGAKPRVSNDGPAFTVAASFETERIGGEKNVQSGVYLVNINTKCEIENEELIFIDNIL